MKKKKADIIKGTVTFADGALVQDRTTDYYYSDEYFRRSAAILNPHLRTMSYALCMACFPSTEAKDYDRVYRNAEKLLGELGFTDFEPNEDYKKKPTVDTLGILVAHKVIQDRGEDYSLIVMGLRGAGYGDEWASNLLLDKKGAAVGFNDCMHYADAFLCTYMEKIEAKLCKKVKFWITGYSRVGGVSNLLGARIDRYAPAYRTNTGDIFVYTFEAPAPASKEDRRPYPSIHNTVNPHDIVPKLAPEVWGFKRYGVDDTVFPDIHSEEYEEKIGEVQDRIRAMNPDLHYDPEDFTPKHLERRTRSFVPFDPNGAKTNDEWWYHAKQDEFLDRFMVFIGKKISHPEDGDDPTDRERRGRFVDTYQSAFSAFAKTYIGGTDEERQAMIALVGKIAKEDLKGFRMVRCYLKLWRNNERSTRSLETDIKKIVRKHIEEMPETGMNTQNLGETFNAIENLLTYAIKCLSYDARRHSLSYMATLLTNAKCIILAHYPEVIMAWLQTLDSYYSRNMSDRLITAGNPAEEDPAAEKTAAEDSAAEKSADEKTADGKTADGKTADENPAAENPAEDGQ